MIDGRFRLIIKAFITVRCSRIAGLSLRRLYSVFLGLSFRFRKNVVVLGTQGLDVTTR